MPVKGPKKVSTETIVRQSPRKRKREADESEKHTPKKNGISNTAKQANSQLPVESKDDIVVDEPARSKIAEDLEVATAAHTSRTTKKAKTKSTKPDDSDPESQSESESKKKRVSKAKKESDAMPLAARTQGLKMFVGAHVSIAKGVENAITNAVNIGGNALALFLQSQRKWENPDLKDENKEAFMHACTHHSYDAKSHIVPHGSYLVNLAAKDKDMAEKSYKFFLNDLKRCEKLGIRYYNFHPGATNKEPLPDAIGRIADNLNKALAATETVTPLLENMAGTESIVGSRFSDLHEIIAQIKPEFKSRIGICIDTCHTFAAGYDLRTPEAFKKTFQELDDVVGLQYLKAMHMNDSKGTFGSKKDLHQNIGTGFLGLRAFHNIMNDPRLQNVPLILETPCERPDPKDPKKTIDDKTVWAREIKLLESLIGMDPEGDEFKKLEKDLSDRGKAERDKMVQWQREKEEKDRVKEEKARKKLDKVESKQSKLSFANKAGSKSKGKKESDDSELSN